MAMGGLVDGSVPGRSVLAGNAHRLWSALGRGGATVATDCMGDGVGRPRRGLATAGLLSLTAGILALASWICGLD